MHLLLDGLSRQRLAVIQWTLIMDVEGSTLEHRRLLDHFKTFITGGKYPLGTLYPPTRKCGILVNFGPVAQTVYKLTLPFQSLSMRETNYMVTTQPPLADPRVGTLFPRDEDCPDFLGGSLNWGGLKLSCTRVSELMEK